MYLIYRIIQQISNVVNVNATNIVKNKSQRDKLVNLLHLLCHVTYFLIFINMVDSNIVKITCKSYRIKKLIDIEQQIKL